MKKLLLALTVLLTLSLPAYCGDWTASETRGAVTVAVGTDIVLIDHECWITAITVITDGTNDADVTFYDCASPAEFVGGATTPAASGCKDMWNITVYSTDYYGGRAFPFPLHFSNNVCVDATGTGDPIVYVEYIRSR